MSNYVTCLNSLNPTHKPVFCIRYFKVPRDLGQALQQNCWQILAYPGFQQYFLSPPKGSFPDVFPVLWPGAQQFGLSPSQQNSSQNSWYVLPLDALSVFLPPHVYLASWHPAEWISRSFLKLMLQKGEICGREKEKLIFFCFILMLNVQFRVYIWHN